MSRLAWYSRVWAGIVPGIIVCPVGAKTFCHCRIRPWRDVKTKGETSGSVSLGFDSFSPTDTSPRGI